MAERLIILNKPFRVLSQFSDREMIDQPRLTLSQFLKAPGYRVAGRLDYESEGLLILTNDGMLQQRITHPRYKFRKTYWVQVEGKIDKRACDALSKGVTLKDGLTLPALVKSISEPTIWNRNPPIRHRKTKADSWLKISITEGRNRQVRRMTAAVGFPTLRLIRISVGPWQLKSLHPGQYRIESYTTRLQ